MKKIILSLFLSFLASGLISMTTLSASTSNATDQESYGDCIRFASKEYNERETSLLDTHRITIKALELERGEQMKSHFTFLTLRASLTKMQSIRSDYRTKIDLADEVLKNNLLTVKGNYENRIELCQGKKKEMGEASEL
jgi:hypothetical protein